MLDSFKYLTHSLEDERWGLYLTVAGKASIAEKAIYPPAGHPNGYNFTWEQGRVLQEYQIIYITEGEGILETRGTLSKVKEGSVMIIRPGIWHRYRPLISKGWKEHYIGFNGNFALQIFNVYNFHAEATIIQTSYSDEILSLFYKIIQVAKVESPCYQQLCSGLLIDILATTVAIQKTKSIGQKSEYPPIQKAMLYIRENMDKNINVEAMALHLNMSYSLFRKAFKKHTGLSPAQYHLNLRIQTAVNLLSNSQLSLKEIAFRLGFCSVHYFSKIFKTKTRQNPSNFRP